MRAMPTWTARSRTAPPSEPRVTRRMTSREARFGVLLEVAYAGTHFHGWAAQDDTRTVQGELAGAIRAVDPHASLPRGTSRTDAGVHAQRQLAAFDASVEIPPRGWVLALNQHLPDDACVRSARAVPCRFEPRFAAKHKRYVYRILRDRVRDPLWHERSWRIGWPLDVARLTSEAKAIVGTHDFRAFRSAHDPRLDTVRTVRRVDAVSGAADPRILELVFEGNAFLYNMVRILTGTLVDVARGQRADGAVARALASGLRADAGMTAPAVGLTLEHVELELPADTGAPWPP
jgi:tRNA pseudouridine38-40 synthase